MGTFGIKKKWRTEAGIHIHPQVYTWCTVIIYNYTQLETGFVNCPFRVCRTIDHVRLADSSRETVTRCARCGGVDRHRRSIYYRGWLCSYNNVRRQKRGWKRVCFCVRVGWPISRCRGRLVINTYIILLYYLPTFRTRIAASHPRWRNEKSILLAIINRSL